MGKFVEKYSFQEGINKDTHPESVGNDGNRLLTPGRSLHVENAHVVSSHQGNFGSVESIFGNLKIDNPFTPGSGAKCIGAVEDKENNAIIFFINHSTTTTNYIYRYFRSSGTYEVVFFNGAPDNILPNEQHPVQAAVIGNNLYWTQKGYSGDYGPVRHIDMDFISDYTDADSDRTNIYLQTPQEKLSYSRSSDSSVTLNTIVEDSFRFAYRLQYKNDAYSKLTPWGLPLFASNYPDINVTTNAKVALSRTFTSTERKVVKRIEFCYMKNDSGTWHVFNQQNVVSGTGSYTANFNNPGQIINTLSSQESLSDQPIPVLSECLAFFKDRLFITNNSIGLDVNEAVISSSSVAVVSEALRSGLQFKEGGKYSVGYKFRDTNGRNSLVKHLDTKSFSKLGVSVYSGSNPSSNDYTSVQTTNREYLKVNIAGTAPDWADYLDIVMTKEKNYGRYFQFHGQMLFFFQDVAAGTAAASGIFNDPLDSTRQYYEDASSSIPAIHKNKYKIHILTPLLMPFTPEIGMKVRVWTYNNELPKIDTVSRVWSDRIEISGSFGKDFDYWDSRDKVMFVELFTTNDSAEDEIYYEIGKSFDVSSGTISVVDEYLEGDTHIISTLQPGVTVRSNVAGYRTFNEVNKYWLLVAYASATSDGWETSSFIVSESPTPTLKEAELSQSIYPGDEAEMSAKPLVLDYTKIISNYGRAFTVQREAGNTSQPNKISFSDPFIQNSFINGLHNFDTSNTHFIGNELTKITKLQPVGNNILLAIHERETTSLSIGEGFVKVGDDDFILSKTEGVIGDDRNLLGGYGTLFPESVQSYGGMAFFIDVFRGAIVQYSANGLFPVSDYGMKTFWRDKCKEITDTANFQDFTRRVVAGIDEYHKEYILTVYDENGANGETWGYNFQANKWNSKYSYTPDNYARMGSILFSIIGPDLYEHNANSAYRTFNGVQYDRKVTFYVNADTLNTKRVLNIHLHTDDIGSDPEFKVVVIRTPNGQASYLKVKHFTKSEGTYYAPFLKDENTPEVAAGKLKILDGRDVRDKYFEVDINYEDDNIALLHAVTIVMQHSEYVK